MIKKQLSANPDSLALFFVRAVDAVVSSSSYQVATDPSIKAGVILVIVRPESINLNDTRVRERLFHGIPDTHIKSNQIYVIKNPDADAENETFVMADEIETNYFVHHPVYKSMDTYFKTHIGFANLRVHIDDCIYRMFHEKKTTIRNDVNSIIERYQSVLVNFQDPITDDNRKDKYVKLSLDFLALFDQILNNKIVSKLDGSSLKDLIYTEYCKTIGNIRVENMMDVLKKIEKSGGITTPILGGDDDILIRELFNLNADTPLKRILDATYTMLDDVNRMFKDVIINARVENSNVSDMFWNELKTKMVDAVEKEYAKRAVEDHISCTRFNFEPAKLQKQIGEVNVDVERIETVMTKTKNDIRRIVPKLVMAHYIRRNVEMFRKLFVSWMDDLLRYVEEPHEAARERANARQGIEDARQALERLKQI
jgi:hypothetical protein